MRVLPLVTLIACAQAKEAPAGDAPVQVRTVPVAREQLPARSTARAS
jgi:hypothetical protein